ncbi:MAG: hypothetical protein IBX70_01225 [Clostridia bacterium]|nr:hypothetical protein [Clostridia bacterium]
MKEEQMKILKMIEGGVITAADGMKLLEAIQEGGASEVINIETDDGQIVEISLV